MLAVMTTQKVEFIEAGTGQWPNPRIGGEEEEEL
jgi:hypothetical protein